MNKLTKTKMLELVDSIEDDIEESYGFIESEYEECWIKNILSDALYNLGKLKILLEVEDVKENSEENNS
jgi:hypothetical protein